MELQLPKGTRDLKPNEMIVRNSILNTLKETFEVYGFSPLETPILERYEILASKYAGGSEILKETFKLYDQGKRNLGLRYDLTVPLARFIGMNQNLKLPFKRYQIGEVFRDGPIEKARYRQFTQCDVDVIGSKDMTSDAEIIALTNTIFQKLQLDFTIKINNRKLLNDLLNYCKVPLKDWEYALITIDKLYKIGIKEVKHELGKKINKDSIEEIEKILFIPGNNQEKVAELKKRLKNSQGLEEIQQLLGYLEIMEVNAKFDISLARGLSYYTGTVIEVVLNNSKVKSSVCGGGRYNKIIGSFLGRGDFPAIGISFGLDRIYDAHLEKIGSQQDSVTQYYVIPIKTLNESIKIAEELRKNGFKVDIDLSGKDVKKNLSYANYFKIPYVIFIGSEELSKNMMKIRDMKTGKEELIDINEFIFKNNKITFV